MRLELLFASILPLAATEASGAFHPASQQVVQSVTELQNACTENTEEVCTAAALDLVRANAANHCVLAGFLQFEAGVEWRSAIEEALAQHGTRSVPCLVQFRSKVIRQGDYVCRICGQPYPYRISHAERKTRYNAILQRLTGMRAPWLESAIATRVEGMLRLMPANADASESDFRRWWDALDALGSDRSQQADSTLVALLDLVIPEVRYEVEAEICRRGGRMLRPLRQAQMDPPFPPAEGETVGIDRFWRLQELIDVAEGAPAR